VAKSITGVLYVAEKSIIWQVGERPLQKHRKTHKKSHMNSDKKYSKSDESLVKIPILLICLLRTTNLAFTQKNERFSLNPFLIFLTIF